MIFETALQNAELEFFEDFWRILSYLFFSAGRIDVDFGRRHGLGHRGCRRENGGVVARLVGRDMDVTREMKG